MRKGIIAVTAVLGLVVCKASLAQGAVGTVAEAAAEAVGFDSWFAQAFGVRAGEAVTAESVAARAMTASPEARAALQKGIASYAQARKEGLSADEAGKRVFLKDNGAPKSLAEVSAGVLTVANKVAAAQVSKIDLSNLKTTDEAKACSTEGTVANIAAKLPEDIRPNFLAAVETSKALNNGKVALISEGDCGTGLSTYGAPALVPYAKAFIGAVQRRDITPNGFGIEFAHDKGMPEAAGIELANNKFKGECHILQ